jgi:hypothetical protein
MALLGTAHNPFGSNESSGPSRLIPTSSIILIYKIGSKCKFKLQKYTMQWTKKSEHIDHIDYIDMCAHTHMCTFMLEYWRSSVAERPMASQWAASSGRNVTLSGQKKSACVLYICGKRRPVQKLYGMGHFTGSVQKLYGTSHFTRSDCTTFHPQNPKTFFLSTKN